MYRCNSNFKKRTILAEENPKLSTAPLAISGFQIIYQIVGEFRKL